jgi:hypothetical protein
MILEFIKEFFVDGNCTGRIKRDKSDRNARMKHLIKT